MPLRYAVRMPDGQIGVRALPSKQVADRIAVQSGGQRIIDPRSVTR